MRRLVGGPERKGRKMSRLYLRSRKSVRTTSLCIAGFQCDAATRFCAQALTDIVNTLGERGAPGRMPDRLKVAMAR
jgi:hypothetical protein